MPEKIFVFNTLFKSLREKCPNAEFFLVRIFLFWTKYGDLLSKSSYSDRIRENADQKKTLYLSTLYAVNIGP